MIRFEQDKKYKIDVYSEVEGDEFWIAILELRGDHWTTETAPGWVLSPEEKDAINKKLDALAVGETEEPKTS